MVVASKFHREAIITGHLDSLCLACEEHLKCERDADAHVAKPVHRKNILALQYAEKYCDDHIRKVKKGYYCEFCNLLLATATRVNLHVDDAYHRNKKGMQLLKRVGNDVIAFNNICIKELSWNGMIDHTCVICNTEFEDERVHKNERDHLINLVQNKIEFDSNNNVYRKTDETSFQCLTCNTVLALGNLISHFDDEDHKNQYSKCRVLNSLNVEESKVKDDANAKLPDIKKPAVKPTSNTTQTDPKPKSNQIKTEKKPIEVQPTIDRNAHICKSLNAPGFITNAGQGRIWCILCEWIMDVESVPVHKISKHHLTLLGMQKDRMKGKANQNVRQKSPEEDIARTNLDDNDVEGNKSKILDSLSKFQQNRFKIDLIAGTAFCKVCSKNINYNFDAIENHIEEHKKKPDKKESSQGMTLFITAQYENKPQSTSLYTRPMHLKKKDDEESLESKSVSSSASREEDDEDLETFARLNNLTIDRVSNKACCHACGSKMPNSLRNMKQHVAGVKHKSNMSKVDIVRKPQKDIIKQPMHDFVNTLTTVQFILGVDIVINDVICVNLFSFLAFSKAGSKVVCLVCDVKLNPEVVEEHKQDYRHFQNYERTTIITSLDSEFVRELRPGFYHCGYCNSLFDDWNVLEDHLQSTDHRRSKISAEWRLNQHLPEIRQNRDLDTFNNFTSYIRLMNSILT